MIIPQTYIPDNIMTGMFGIYARRLLIEKIVKERDHITINGLPIIDKTKKPLPVDQNTFECIGYGFFKDKNTIYGLTYIMRKNSEQYYFTPFKNIDLDSFQPISMLYAKDKNSYYYAEGAKTINEPYLKPLVSYTSKYQDENFPNLKATHTWSSDITIGQNFVYNRGLKLKDADASTFQQISQYYYSDKNNIFWKKGLSIKPLKNIDVESFIVLADNNHAMATDKYVPMVCYGNDDKPEKWFKYYRNYFEELRGKISDDYWWYKIERALRSQETI